MSNKTAVEWIFDQIPFEWSSSQAAFEALQVAKMMEKEQHEKTWFDSTLQFDNAAEMTYKQIFEEYYNETYKGGEQ